MDNKKVIISLCHLMSELDKSNESTKAFLKEVEDDRTLWMKYYYIAGEFTASLLGILENKDNKDAYVRAKNKVFNKCIEKDYNKLSMSYDYIRFYEAIEKAHKEYNNEILFCDKPN